MKLLYLALLCTLWAQSCVNEMANQTELQLVDMFEEMGNLTGSSFKSSSSRSERMLNYLDRREIRYQIIDIDSRYHPASPGELISFDVSPQTLNPLN